MAIINELAHEVNTFVNLYRLTNKYAYLLARDWLHQIAHRGFEFQRLLLLNTKYEKMYYQISLIWRMHTTHSKTCQKDGNLLKVTTLRMTNVLGMLLFLWWLQTPFVTFAILMHSHEFIEKTSNKVWRRDCLLNPKWIKLIGLSMRRLKGKMFCPLIYAMLLSIFGHVICEWVPTWSPCCKNVPCLRILGVPCNLPSFGISCMWWSPWFHFIWIQ